MIKKIATIILVVFLVMHLVPIILTAYELLGHIPFSKTYVHSIDLPSYGNENAKKMLDIFDKLGDNGAVKYTGYRPVFIVEQDLNKSRELKKFFGDRSSTLGLAFPLPAYCLIVIDSNLTPHYFMHTLWHEYVHCFGYGHADVKTDLMYPYFYGYIDLESTRFYAKEIKGILDGR